MVCRESPKSAAAPPGDTRRPPYLSNSATSFGSPPERFASGIVVRLSHTPRLVHQLILEVQERWRDDAAPAVDHADSSPPELSLDVNTMAATGHIDGLTRPHVQP